MGAWCANTNDKAQYLQVDLGEIVGDREMTKSYRNFAVTFLLS